MPPSFFEMKIFRYCFTARYNLLVSCHTVAFARPSASPTLYKNIPHAKKCRSMQTDWTVVKAWLQWVCLVMFDSNRLYYYYVFSFMYQWVSSSILWYTLQNTCFCLNLKSAPQRYAFYVSFVSLCLLTLSKCFYFPSYVHLHVFMLILCLSWSKEISTFLLL